MYGIHKVLVGVDLVCADIHMPAWELPPPTVEAVEIGLRVAARSRAQVLFLSVMPEASASDPAVTEVHNQLVASATERGVTASSKVVTGRAWLEIIREVVHGGHDLVVVGSRQHRTRERLLGTTGSKLLRKCPCPVWVARADAAPDTPTVLVADDLTDVGAHCIQLGVAVAQLLPAKLLVVHAMQFPLESSLRRTECPPEEIDAYRARQQDECRKFVSDHLAKTDYRTLNYGVVVEVEHGPPDVVLQNAVDEHHVDLLVMGTVARSGIPGLLVGNTAERLLPDVTCSILAVKPEGFETPVRFA